MRVAVNGKSFGIEQKGGAVRVGLSLVRFIAIERPDVQLEVFLPITHDRTGPQVPDLPPEVIVHTFSSRFFASGWGRSLWEQIAFPLYVRQRGPFDALINLTNSAPVLISAGVPQLLLLHDVGFWNTRWFSGAFSRYLQWIVTRAAKRGYRFVTVSKSTAEAMLRVVPGLRHVEAVWNASDEAPAIVPKPPIDGRYIIFVGSLNPRKNVAGALAGFRAYKEMTGDDVRMVVIGETKSIFAKQDVKSQAAQDIHFLGYMDGVQKWAWIKGAEVLVLPSFLESFGLPVLEALTVGTPAVGSDLLPFRELYGEAIEYVDPHSPTDIARGIRRVLETPSRREEMRRLGARVVERYSWASAARQYGVILDDMTRSGGANR